MLLCCVNGDTIQKCVVSAGYTVQYSAVLYCTVLYVPDYALVGCISHNKQRPSCTPEENVTSLGVKSGEREMVK